MATPLLVVWLFWASATAVPPAGSPLSHSFDEELHQAAVLKERALVNLNVAQTDARMADSQSRVLSRRPMKSSLAR